MSRDANKLVAEAMRERTRREFSGAVSRAESFRKGTHRVPSASELAAAASAASKAPNHYYVFCTHEVPYWDVCRKCGRDCGLARKNADLVLKSVGGAAFFTK